MTLALDSPRGRLGTGLDTPLHDRQLIRIAAGIFLSLVAHVLLLAIYRQPAAPAAVPAPPEAITVRLRPVAPPEPPAVQRSAPPALAAKAPPAQASRPARLPPTPPAVIAVAPAQRQSAEDSFAVKPPPQTPADPAVPAPRFDLGAARALARKLADEPDPAKAGTALERLPPPPLQTESKLERAIKGAKRANCKDGVPGGLLAPLFLAMDKKDSGCKW
jgi:hypothetical protein